MTKNEIPLVIENLGKIYYPEITALDNINLMVTEGETVGIIGNNGAGKSTLIRILATLLVPSMGNLEIFGCEVFYENYKAIRPLIGYLPEKFSFYPYFTVTQIIDFFTDFNKKAGLNAGDNDLVEELIEVLALEPYLNQKIKNLSKGSLQKTGILVSLLHKPSLLLLDEPTTGLDPLTRRSIRNFLLNLASDWNTTMIISSHILEDIEYICDRVVILEMGSMINEPLYITDLRSIISKYTKLVTTDNRNSSIKDFLKTEDSIFYQHDEGKISTIYCEKSAENKIVENIDNMSKGDQKTLIYPLTLEDIYFFNKQGLNIFDLK